MLGHVVQCQSSAELWMIMEKLFSTKSKARVLQLRLLLQTTKKGGGSFEDYILKMKDKATSLIAAGQQISDDELVLYILGGLGLEYESVVVNLTSRYSLTLQEVQYVLQTHEVRLEHLNATAMVEISDSSAHLIKKQPQFFPQSEYHYNLRGRNNRGGRGRGIGRCSFSFGNSNKLLCQICGKSGRTAVKYYHRFDLSYQTAASSIHPSNNSPSDLCNNLKPT